MKNFLLFALSILSFQTLSSQNDDFNLTIISNVTYAEDNNDVWGYVDTSGVEYGIVGTATATEVLSLADPANPELVIRVDGGQTIWRDMKTYSHYIYSVCDQCNDGLVIIDMEDPVNPIFRVITSMIDSTDNSTKTLDQFHNIFVDEFGYLYADGGNLNSGGVVIMDLNQDPYNPHIVGYGPARYSHDIYVRNNIVYSADIYAGFIAVLDATDKSNITVMATQTTTSMFAHNSWLSDNSQVLFTTDELDFSNVDAYDISDLSDIKRLDTYRPASTRVDGTTPHNVHVLNDYLVTSWYTDGVKVVDAQYPDNLIEVASFDTWDGPNGGTRGNWGAYPFLPSGLLLITDISSGFYVLQPDYQRASYLEGRVTDAVKNSSIPQVEITIQSINPNIDQTTNFGTYKTGVAETGSLDVLFSHALYQDTVVNVRLKGDSITILDVAMQPLYAYINMTGKVVDSDGNGVPDAEVLLAASDVTYNYVTNTDGEFLGEIFDTDYNVIASLWGFGDTLFTESGLNMNLLEINLPGNGEYYQDRFFSDQGWNVENNAATGDWERGIPQGTFNGAQGILNPDEDSPFDIGEECYGTGLIGNSFFDNDVDGTYNTMISPVATLLGTETRVDLSFDYWFHAHNNGNAFNDSLVVNVYLDGNLVAPIAKISERLGEWRQSNVYNLLDAFDFSPVVGALSVSFVIGDDNPGVPLEAGVDNVKIIFDRTSGTKAQPVADASILIYPNPVEDILHIDVSQFEGRLQRGVIYNAKGAEVWRSNDMADYIQIPFNFASGLYALLLTDAEGSLYSKKIVH